ncbi:MAG: pantoate--beta-alanine ligase [Pseudomonadota bacterium]
MTETTQAPVIATQLDDLRTRVRVWREAGATIALVPTMGALHDGHLSLVRHAKEACTRTVVSIFVNPTQFAPNEDFATYPRDDEGDLAKLAAKQVDLVWMPTPALMYPPDFATTVEPRGAAQGLESETRPHFFAGVATVCTKLFVQVAPDVAVFGEKDYQQLQVIRQTVRDLDLPMSILGAPTIRESDGLAMSSRNAYLDADERKRAGQLYAALQKVSAAVRAGDDHDKALGQGRKVIERAGFKLDYLVLRDARTLSEPRAKAEPVSLRVLVAAHLGKTRLIDNIAVDEAG